LSAPIRTAWQLSVNLIPAESEHRRHRWQDVCDLGVFAGLGIAVVFAPLAFGAVHVWAYTTLEWLLGACAVLWCVRTFADAAGCAWRSTARAPRESRPGNGIAMSAYIRTRYASIAAGALAAWAMFLVVPLPPPVLRVIAPKTYSLLMETLPGWPATAGYASAAGADGPSTVAATWRPVALSPALARAELLRLLAYVIALLVVAYYPWAASPHRIRGLAYVLIVVALVEASYFLLQDSFASPNIYWFRKSSDTWRPAGTYINRDHFAGLLAMLTPVAAGAAAQRIAQLARRLSAENAAATPAQRRRALGEWLTGKAGVSVALWMCVTVWLLMALYRSLSRGGFLSLLAVSCLLAPLLWPRRSTLAAPRRHGTAPGGRSAGWTAWLSPTILLLGLGVLLVTIDLPELAGRLDAPELAAAVAERSKPLHGALEMIADFPLFGVGPGNFEFTFPLYRDFGNERFTHVHNDYLELAAEMGLPALALTGVLIVALYRRVAAACAAASPPSFLLWGCLLGVFTLLLHSVVDFNLHIPANALVLAVLIGITIRLTRAPHEVCATPRAPAIRMVAAAATAVVVLVAGAAHWRPARVEAAFRRDYPDSSLRSLLAADAPSISPRERLHGLEMMAASLPANPFLQYVTGVELQREALSLMSGTKDREASQALLERAARRYVAAVRALPQASGPHLQLGILGLAGVSGVSRPQARAALALAQQLDPFDPTINATVAVLLRS